MCICYDECLQLPGSCLSPYHIHTGTRVRDFLTFQKTSVFCMMSSRARHNSQVFRLRCCTHCSKQSWWVRAIVPRHSQNFCNFPFSFPARQMRHVGLLWWKSLRDRVFILLGRGTGLCETLLTKQNQNKSHCCWMDVAKQILLYLQMTSLSLFCIYLFEIMFSAAFFFRGDVFHFFSLFCYYLFRLRWNLVDPCTLHWRFWL